MQRRTKEALLALAIAASASMIVGYLVSGEAQLLSVPVLAALMYLSWEIRNRRQRNADIGVSRAQTDVGPHDEEK